MASKTALLDVNVLIALLGSQHKYHVLVADWLFDWLMVGNRWVSCPITQNGCVRILSLPSYENGFNILEVKDKSVGSCQTNHTVFVLLDGRIATHTALGIDEQDFICLD